MLVFHKVSVSEMEGLVPLNHKGLTVVINGQQGGRERRTRLLASALTERA